MKEIIYMPTKKKNFIENIIKYINEEKSKGTINIFIDKYLEDNTIDFEINFDKEVFKGMDKEYYKEYDKKDGKYKKIYKYQINLYFKEIIFEKSIAFKHIKLKKLELRDVVFKHNVGIKSVCIDHLILRPYEIHGHVVVNVEKYARDYGLLIDTGKYYIHKIHFEDPHVPNGKIFFIGTNFKKGYFRNRTLDNVVFQNCDFENTYFLNSFLDKATFLNCKFPKIKNENSVSFMGNITHYGLIILLYVLLWVFILEHNILKDYFELVIGITMVIAMPYIIATIYTVNVIFEWYLYKLYGVIPFKGKTKQDEPLLYHHIGIADERRLNNFINIKYRKTFMGQIKYIINLLFNCQYADLRKKQLKKYKQNLENINSIYNDLKVNFKNVSDSQQSGDFHYAQKITSITLSTRFFDTIILMYSYIINGFGERYIRAINYISLILIILIFWQTPNEDYISTEATPPFLLSVIANNYYNQADSIFPIEYGLESFHHISKVYKNKYKEGKEFYAFNNRNDFNFTNQYVPKLNDDFIVRIYYATSHIVSPFTQENKKWFKNMTKESYIKSISISILLWIFLIGMVTAIFNRIRR